jgi:hypothetical protein
VATAALVGKAKRALQVAKVWLVWVVKMVARAPMAQERPGRMAWQEPVALLAPPVPKASRVCRVRQDRPEALDKPVSLPVHAKL